MMKLSACRGRAVINHAITAQSGNIKRCMKLLAIRLKRFFCNPELGIDD